MGGYKNRRVQRPLLISKFIEEIREASPYVDDSVVHKFAKAYDGSVYKK